MKMLVNVCYGMIIYDIYIYYNDNYTAHNLGCYGMKFIIYDDAMA